MDWDLALSRTSEISPVTETEGPIDGPIVHHTSCRVMPRSWMRKAQVRPEAVTEGSQHVQVFAVLAGASVGEDAKKLMRRSVNEWTELDLARASFAMSFYDFRAVALVEI